MKIQQPNLYFEKKLWKEGYLVIGIDEVGRGAFAGPLVVGGVVFRPSSSRKEIRYLESLGVNDSKKIKREERERLAKIIKKTSQFYAYASISARIINKVGIGKATQLGVRKVVKSIMYKVSSIKYNKNKKSVQQNTRYFLLIDAFYIKYIKGIGLAHQKAIIHGDEISLSIAAASIIAKVARDALMKKMSKVYPKYGFERHVGYGTLAHREAIIKFGKLEIHREQFVKTLAFNFFVVQPIFFQHMTLLSI